MRQISFSEENSVWNTDDCYFHPAQNTDELRKVHFETRELCCYLFNYHPWSDSVANFDSVSLLSTFKAFCLARALNGHFVGGNLDRFSGSHLIESHGVKATSWHRWLCRIAELKFVRLFWVLDFDAFGRFNPHHALFELRKRLRNADSTELSNAFFGAIGDAVLLQDSFERFDELDFEFQRASKELNENVSATITLLDVDRSLENLEKIESRTPKLNAKSVEWIAAREKNVEKLGLSVSSLRNYRAPSKGGRTNKARMFGIDRDGRIWRRQGTEESMVYYYAPSLTKSIVKKR